MCYSVSSAVGGLFDRGGKALLALSNSVVTAKCCWKGGLVVVVCCQPGKSSLCMDRSSVSSILALLPLPRQAACAWCIFLLDTEQQHGEHLAVTSDTQVGSLVFCWHGGFNYLSPAVSCSLFYEPSLGSPGLFQQTCRKVELKSVAAYVLFSFFFVFLTCMTKI